VDGSLCLLTQTPGTGNIEARRKQVNQTKEPLMNYPHIACMGGEE